MNNDIVPSLLETIQKQFDEEIKSNETIKTILKKQKQGAVDYTDSLSFAKELGVSLKKVLQKNINEDMLPDGRMYYNIAQRLLKPMIKQNYDLVSKQCEVTQNLLNKKANLSLKAIVSEYDEEKTVSIIDYISNADKYSQREKSFLAALETNAKSIVDDSVRINADFHYNAGLRPKIIRTTVGKTCKWCQSMAGVYDYSKINNTGNDVFRRHANCDCAVVYDPGNGSKTVQNVWDKKVEYKPNQEEVAKRIQKINAALMNENRLKYKLNLQLFAKYKSLRLDAHTRSELNTWLKHDEIEPGTLMLKDIGDYRYYFVYNDFDSYTLYKKIKIRGKVRSK